MPKLTNHIFALTTDDGHRHHFDSEIHVSTDGEFSCTVPDFLVPTLNACGAPYNKHGNVRYADKLKVNYRAYAPSKSHLLEFVSEAHRDFYKAEVTTDLIICYDWFAEVSYWLNPDGSMAANGSMPDAARRNDDGTGGNWDDHKLKGSHTTICATHTAKHFSVGVFAAIYERTTHTRASGLTIKWRRLTQFSGCDTGGEWAKKLSGLCGLSGPMGAEHMKQLPYTEDAAKFFYESMMAMCEIGRRFKNFFADDANVLAAIEGRGPSLLKAPAAPAAIAAPVGAKQ